MRKVAIDDIVGLRRYETIRQDFRRRIIELKQKRRISLGDRLSLVFENRPTVIFQIQEMLRVEKLAIWTRFARRLPPTISLSLTQENSARRSFSRSRTKLICARNCSNFRVSRTRSPCVSLRISYRRVLNRGRSKENKIRAVHYIRFRFDDQALEAFVSGTRTELVIDHRNYQAAVVLQPETQRSLVEDLTT